MSNKRPKIKNKSEANPTDIAPSEIQNRQIDSENITTQEADVIEAYGKLSDESRMRVSVLMSKEFSGPLPPASEFAEYERVLPGAADRILIMAEKQITMAEHEFERRVNNETKIIDHEIWDDNVGLIMAFISLIIILVVVVFLSILGSANVAMSIVAVIGVIIGLFICRQWKNNNTKEKKK